MDGEGIGEVFCSVLTPSGVSARSSSAQDRTECEVGDGWEETTQEQTCVCGCVSESVCVWGGEADIPSCWETVFWL